MTASERRKPKAEDRVFGRAEGKKFFCTIMMIIGIGLEPMV
jgi:hypothetical protein